MAEGAFVYLASMISLGQHSDRSATFLVERESAVSPRQFAEFLPRSAIKAFLESGPTLASFVAQGISISCISDQDNSYFYRNAEFKFDKAATYAFRIALAHSSQ